MKVEVVEMAGSRFNIGATTVTQIIETAQSELPPAIVFPDCDETFLSQNRWMMGRYITDDGQHLKTGNHSWLVRTPNHVVLVDTGAGNSKKRPSIPMFNQLKKPFLDRLSIDHEKLARAARLATSELGWGWRRSV